MLSTRRDGRVGRRRSPAKRVYWETGIEGSNPSLSATISSDTPLIHSRIFMLFAYVFFGVGVLTVCRVNAAMLPNDFRSSASHSTAIEKAVVVPPEVMRRWKAIKLAVIDKSRGTENIYVVPIGSIYKVPSSSLIIIVDAFLPAFIMEGMTITTSSNDLLNPGAKVRISENGTLVFQGWLFARFPNTHAVTHPKYGISLIGVVPVAR